MKKILFPTDFSKSSLNAFVYALHFAKHTDAEIVVLHVYELPIIDTNYNEAPIYLAQIYDTIDLGKFENFKDQVPVLRKIAEENQLEDVKMSNVMLEGDLVNNILQIVEKEDVDYVVMGTHGAEGFQELLGGSMTSKIMLNTKAKVLGVPAESEYVAIKRIVFTTKFEEEDIVALKNVTEIAKAFNAHIDCLHIKSPKSKFDQKLLTEWEIMFEDENVDFHIVESDEVEASVMDFVNTHRSNLLAVLNHKRGFFESIFHSSLTKKLAYHSKTPLLVLH